MFYHTRDISQFNAYIAPLYTTRINKTLYKYKLSPRVKCELLSISAETIRGSCHRTKDTSVGVKILFLSPKNTMTLFTPCVDCSQTTVNSARDPKTKRHKTNLATPSTSARPSHHHRTSHPNHMIRYALVLD